tara:strand:+ start:17785 stop:19056 length:1272 start_codon:yes stop_codon:yes gene_type:complete
MKKILITLIIFITSLVVVESIFDLVSLKKKSEKIKLLKEVKTSYHHFTLKYIEVPVFSKYGAIVSFKKDLIYISGDSEFFILKKNKNSNEYFFTSLKIDKIKNNKDKFVNKNQEELGHIADDLFGVKDILIENFNSFEKKVIIVSSLDYLDEKNCYKISLFLTEIIDEDTFKVDKWKKIFSSKKCLTINLTQNPKFAAYSAGGRISKLDENNIIFTIGDFFADGKNGPILSQDLENHYGKILKVNIMNNSYEIFSFGHRNPQGLYIDKKKNIFSTEHGPRHGDEINLIMQDKNYGWPKASFGTSYVSPKWPLDETNSTHDNYEKPILSFGNTIGISNLIVYEGNYFDRWKNNLVVSTLASQKLIRLVFNEQKKSIIYIENIPIKKRIRDIVEFNGGKIALLTDRGNPPDNNPQIIIFDKYKSE